MRRFKIVLIVVTGLVILLAGIGFLLPNEFALERSVVIQAAPQRVFKHINNFHEWKKWTPWNVEEDTSLVVKYSGPSAGVGASQSWTSNDMGVGSMVITSSETGKRMAYDISMGNEFIAKGEMLLTASGQQTTLQWRFFGEIGMNPFARYFAVFIDSMAGPTFDKGLQNLKKLAEAN